MAVRKRFDEAYYERFYFNPKTRVNDQKSIDRLGAFVASYLEYFRIPVRRVLDGGCGIGLWRQVIATHFPKARYEGIEVSEYLCERYGFTHASIVDYQPRGRYDLVLSQGVLPYLSSEDALAAIANMARLCRGALYLEAVTIEDWQYCCDRERSDDALHLREADWYRAALSRFFIPVGGGVWLSRELPFRPFALEQA